MLHEFTVTAAYDKVPEWIDRLNAKGIFNIFYETPFDLTTDENGYGFEVITDADIELKIYAEEEAGRDMREEYMLLISEALQLPPGSIFYQRIEQENWQEPFEDIDLGSGWIICSPDRNDLYPDKRKIIFEPQGAFGTGLHETTQDCLRLILEHDFSGKSVADLGTGSGILSIAAGLRLADSILAIDIEPVEREIKHNASLNKIFSIEVRQRDLLSGEYKLERPFDWAFLNIGADETIAILKRLDLLGSFQGSYLISGLLEWNYAKIISLLEPFGFSVDEKRQTNEWVTLVLKKRQ